MPRLGRRVHPVIVAAAEEPHRQRRELGIRHVVEARDVDRDVGAADLRHMTAAKRPARRGACRTGDARASTRTGSPTAPPSPASSRNASGLMIAPQARCLRQSNSCICRLPRHRGADRPARADPRRGRPRLRARGGIRPAAAGRLWRRPMP